LLDFDFEPELPLWAKALAVFDLETTGLDVATARIVTATVATLDQNGVVVELSEWLVNPGIEIPEAASNVHGVTTERAIAEGSDPANAVAEIIGLLKKHNQEMPLVAFNAPYDFSILKAEAQRYGIAALDPKPVIDPLVLDRKVDRFRKGKRNLGVMSEHYGIKLEDAHNATADAVAAGRIAQQLARKYPELAIDALELHDLQAEWSDQQAESFAEYLRKQNRPDYRAELGWPIKLT
jgi:DNA polymerase III subunit epsilon